MKRTSFRQGDHSKMSIRIRTRKVGLVACAIVWGFSMAGVAAAPRRGPPPPATDLTCSGCVDSTDLSNTSVTSAKVADGAVTTTKVADGAVTAAKHADGSV